MNTSTGGAVLGLDLLGMLVSVSGAPQVTSALAGCFDGAQWLPASPSGARLQIRVALGGNATPGGVRLSTVPAQVADELDLGRVTSVPRIASALTRWAVAESRNHYVFHAGAVVRGSRAVLLPGPSGCGKSSVTLALLRRGFHFLSDEIAAIDLQSHSVVPYPRFLCVRRGTLRALRLQAFAGAWVADSESVMVPLEAVGGRRAACTAPPKLIVFPRFSSGPALRHLQPTEAAQLLLDSSCSHAHHKVRGLDLVLSLAAAVPAYRLEFADSEDAASRIDSMLP